MLFYLVGIKGTGMSGLAKVLLDYGYLVKGCDVSTHYFTEDSLDIKIDDIDNVVLDFNCYYIIGNAFSNHSIVKKIIAGNYQYDYYAHFIANFFSKNFICVSGTHGKTTTASLLKTLNPTANYLIGDGSGHGNKDDKWFILEACEYRNTFLNYKPKIALILNIDFDHPDFFKDINSVLNSFEEFSNKSELVILNGDFSSGIKLCGNVIRYGMNEDNDIVFKYDNNKVYLCGETYEMPYKGKHYAYNFVGAYIVSKLMNIRSDQILERIKNWQLPKRRREITELGSQVILCDYAHHPAEIKCLFESINIEYPSYKKIIIYEPHTYSRTLSLIKDYIKALNLFDSCYIYDIFTSRRENYDLKLENAIYKELMFEKFKEYLFLRFKEMSNILLCFVGAGKIDMLYKKYLIE